MSDNSPNSEQRRRTTPPPLPPQYQPTPSGSYLEPWKALIGLGGALAAALFIFVQETSVFGESCYHIGDITMQTICLDREIYLGAWVVAAGMVGLGIIQGINAASRGPRP